MKLKFKVQAYQTNAVEAVVDCFAGQPRSDGISYRIDPGRSKQITAEEAGFKNADLQIPKSEVLKNIQAVQRHQNLPISDKLISSAGCDYNLDIEMETGTGKTYCYVKTMFEMHKRYGWSKFIIMVPSIAIREGVQKSLQITAEHFTETYGKKARFFTYNSKRLHELESFSSDAGINVMVINTQAFAAKGKDQLRIYMELDDFQSRRPIDVISRNRPILILDEPQKMEGKATSKALEEFNPLMILRYSATHKTQHNKIHRLDALDAFNQKLVKKIAVRGIQTRGLAGAAPYMYLEGIEVSQKAPVARIEMEVKLANGDIKRQLKRLEFGRDLLSVSNGLQAYNGFTISQIDANEDTVEFTKGFELRAGEATQDISEEHMRRIQIRETIRAHFEKEQTLFTKGIKVLSLFFIDTVSRYRDYDTEDTKGHYAQVFEEEYEILRDEYLLKLPLEHQDYRAFLERDEVSKVHEGYFSIDKKNRLVDPSVKKTGDEKGLATDEDAYDLILRNKERLLSQNEPVRFIFSHSALREGWDNPNVFTMCMLKHSDNTISRRQEVGRGLRLSVDQTGDRMDHPSMVHDINVLTVVASESYKDFVANLQKEISEALASRPRKANEAYFKEKVLRTEHGDVSVTPEMASQIEFYLIQNGYVDHQRQVVEAYHTAKTEEALAPLPDTLVQYAPQVFELVDSVFSADALSRIVDDGRKPKTNPLNDNFEKKAFKELWERINQKAVYRVDFDSDELVEKCVAALNKELNVTPLQYTVQVGSQGDSLTAEQLSDGKGFKVKDTRIEHGQSAFSSVKYDLLQEVSENAQLTRQTVARMLSSMEKAVFDQFKKNPEQFISEASRLIKEQKATVIIERLTYDTVEDRHDIGIFTAAQTGNDFSKATDKLTKHVFDHAIVDSNVEREFVAELDTSSEVVVYAKLPRDFLIPTPVGDYNPDWAISFEEGSVRHIYFVAETKGSMSSMKLRPEELTKIECARKFFAEISKADLPNNVRYDVVDSYSKLMDLVARQ
ncbi:type III restriction enzyme [Planktotalea frisia]|uniref:Type III restriction enzyme, res subunit n=1 Tax=Planktotalea frisia TaxID=696762 RepID=A0A1L9P0F6_9RHOB|nr:DEAD/DEAH box helicase family protein [Planktotalea frisia]OJI95007.1 type III restriction enzyme, res subunit [Planktotalea frisia]PZX31556.1 type III restriction enzyme [Planktotalea frisia]